MFAPSSGARDGHSSPGATRRGRRVRVQSVRTFLERCDARASPERCAACGAKGARTARLAALPSHSRSHAHLSASLVSLQPHRECRARRRPVDGEACAPPGYARESMDRIVRRGDDQLTRRRPALAEHALVCALEEARRAAVPRASGAGAARESVRCSPRHPRRRDSRAAVSLVPGALSVVAAGVLTRHLSVVCIRRPLRAQSRAVLGAPEAHERGRWPRALTRATAVDALHGSRPRP